MHQSDEMLHMCAPSIPNFSLLYLYLAGRLGEDIRKLILKIYDAFLSPDGKVLQQSLLVLLSYPFLRLIA